jgi:hypothetical protein
MELLIFEVRAMRTDFDPAPVTTIQTRDRSMSNPVSAMARATVVPLRRKPPTTDVFGFYLGFHE